jgi:hypothetical protein
MTLRRWRPILSIEIEERHRLGSTRSVPELLSELGYEGRFQFLWRMATHREPGSCDDAASPPVSGGVHGVAPIRVQLFSCQVNAERN